MRKTLIIGACLLFSCNVRKEKLKTKNEIQNFNTQQTERQLTVQKATATKDSTNEVFQVVIHPRGTFKFDVNKGFEGEALNLTIRGQKDRLSQSHSSSTKQETQQSFNTQLHQAKNESTIYNKVVKHNFNWWWLICIFPVFLIYRWIKK